MSTVDSPNLKRIVDFMCDPALGATPEQCASLREQFAKPDAARAFHQYLMARDLSNFDPSHVHMLPPKLVDGLRAHFPERF
jgi:hypothetical protein